MYFESHAHYDDKRFNEDRDELFKSLKECGVEYVVNSGANLETSLFGIELSKKYDFVYAAVGVHPHDSGKLNEDEFLKLKSLTKEDKVVAIGEIGLDFHYDFSDRDDQRFWFKRQLELAKEVGLPVIIHAREASQEVFDTLKEANLSNRGGKGAGVIHCYSGSLEMAKEYIKMGYYIGIGGVVTYANAKKTVEVVDGIPIDSILIETDCPYLSPVPMRGKRNDSRNLKYVVDKISEITQKDKEIIKKITLENAKRLFLQK